HEVDADLTSGRYPQVGVRIVPNDRMRFAFVYRGEFQTTLDIDARIDVEARALGIHVPLFTYITARSINAFLPRQFVIGGSIDVTERFTLDADVTWINWAAYRSPATRITATTQVGPGLPDFFLPENPAPTVIIAPTFENRIVPRIGGELRLPVGPLRLG